MIRALLLGGPLHGSPASIERAADFILLTVRGPSGKRWRVRYAREQEPPDRQPFWTYRYAGLAAKARR